MTEQLKDSQRIRPLYIKTVYEAIQKQIHRGSTVVSLAFPLTKAEASYLKLQGYKVKGTKSYSIILWEKGCVCL